MQLGRPSSYTQETADKICELLADGQSLRKVCENEWAPTKATIFKWMRDFPEFLNQYTRAKEESADSMSDEMNDIADDARNDWMERLDEEGKGKGWQVNGEHIQRSRLRIETRKWLASKLKPKKYGDKLAVGGAEDLPPLRIQKLERVIVHANPDHPDRTDL